MPSKDTMHIVVGVGAKEDLRDVFIRASLDGVDLTYQPRCLPGKAPPRRKLSASMLARQAFHYAAVACRAAVMQVAPALPEKAGSADADRLRSAMGKLEPIEVCRAAGLKDGASIRNVVNKGAKLAGKLLAWVESQEASK